ncbi:toll-like receptor 9 [Musca autumnalis]|uniref:toll-like receptor 9 n=1 Tax=Musca autumnalis TaxID=221902 RepID=UPI003CF8AAC2
MNVSFKVFFTLCVLFVYIKNVSIHGLADNTDIDSSEKTAAEFPVPKHKNGQYSHELHQDHISNAMLDNRTDRGPLRNVPETNMKFLYNFSNIDFDPILSQLDRDYDYRCLMDDFKSTLLWWTFANGTLKNRNLHASTITFLDVSHQETFSDDELLNRTRTFGVSDIVVFSAAHNNLSSVPYNTLSSMSSSVKFLTLCGNNFNNFKMSDTQKGDGKGAISWATFPSMPTLMELDMSNCAIQQITKETFRNLSNLKKLYMSGNKILELQADTFFHVSSLQYLDLSFMNVFDYTTIPTQTLDTLFYQLNGVKIPQMTFKYLPNLSYLDFSHTKLSRNSAVAFTQLGSNLRYLSLCYTAFPMIGSAIFKNTALVGLDLSGNAFTAYNVLDDAFEGISETLSVLFFELSNLKNISWVRSLNNLRVLGLAGNNINSITFDIFNNLTSLEVLDLSTNHIGNWYSRVFTNNEKLRVLSLRDNNINIITSEMLKDFGLLHFLSLGDNNFVCDCLLRDLVDIGNTNTRNLDCAREIIDDALEYANDSLSENITAANIIALHTLMRLQNKVKDQKSANNLGLEAALRKIRFIFNRTDKSSKTCSPPTQQTSPVVMSKLNDSTILDFQLLDYDDEHYWCFNETEKLSFFDLNCHQRSLVDDIVQQLDSLTYYVVVIIGTLLTVSLVGIIIYMKRWHIYYYYSSLKSAALMSEAVKETNENLQSCHENGGANMIYDIFISYCQTDRDWVLNELMPNVEDNDDIKICLHERDFQIGVTILDNIISCMDRSRSLMLIISSSFLLSHWCQFEMHLAQRRMFDVCRDCLILVFLEEIPRHKRPKNLQYLMDVKTYIKWPGGKSNNRSRPEDYKIFWKRLKRSMHRIATDGVQ